MAAGTGELVDFHSSFPFFYKNCGTFTFLVFYKSCCIFTFLIFFAMVVVLSLHSFFLKRCPTFCILLFCRTFFYVYFHFPICFAIFFVLSPCLFVRRCEQLPYGELSVTSVGAQTDVTDVTSVTDAQSSQCWFATLQVKMKGEKWKYVKTAIDTTEETCWHVNFGQFCKSVI